VDQLEANILCLETEILLCNFAFVAYSFGSFNDVHLTVEEKRAAVQNPDYDFIAHLENALTDIQGTVFQSKDKKRVVVSFRGTSAVQNVWQVNFFFSLRERPLWRRLILAFRRCAGFGLFVLLLSHGRTRLVFVVFCWQSSFC